MRIFEINYNRLIVLLLPSFLQKQVWVAFLKALTAPVVTQYNNFLHQRTDNIYKVNITGQVCYLRKMLNDKFDAIERRIYITEGQTNDWVFVYKKELFNSTDNKNPIWLKPASIGVTLLSKRDQLDVLGIDFKVMIPAVIQSSIDENQMKSLLNYYKLASKRYTINYYSI